MHIPALQAISAGFSSQNTQRCEGNGLDASSRGVTWVLTEAVLAAVEQAATARMPAKRKKVAADVLIGVYM